MAESVKKFLENQGVLKYVILTPESDLMLSGLELAGPATVRGGGIFTGEVRLTGDLSKSPVPGFDFSLALPTGIVEPAPFKILLEPPVNPTSFKFWLVISGQGQVHFIFKFIKGLPGLALTGAILNSKPDGTVTLEAIPENMPGHDPVLISPSSEAGTEIGLALLVSATSGSPATMRFTPDTVAAEGIVAFALEPSTVVFGNSGIGFDCPSIVLDDSEVNKAEGQGAPLLEPEKTVIAPDTPRWRGILARQLDFYLPESVPLFGGRPVKGYLAVSSETGGAELIIESRVPSRPATDERDGQPGYSIRIECLDPTARGLSGLVPTLISASMELPLDRANAGFNQENGTGRDITFAAGKPVLLTATFSRDPVNAPDVFRIATGIASQGQEGILSVTSSGMGGAKIFNTAAALATALIADRDIERKADVGDTKGVVLYSLLAAGSALSSLFNDDSRFVLHGAEIESTGHGLPVGGPVSLILDYSVAVIVTNIDIGVLSVSMNPDQPMRIRVRRVRMSLDPSKSGLEMIGLDYDRSEMEIENPGAWNVSGLDSLFDVLGSRSGRGSAWIEVDLRFKLNLGPISVSGATIRATLQNNGTIEASIRGLEAGLAIPMAIEGSGKLELIPGGFGASLQANILPLNLAADAMIVSSPPMIVLGLGVDLPAPIPLANTGFGLFGIGGLLGFSAVPHYNDDSESDPVLKQLQWQSDNAKRFREATGQSTFGLDAVVGTFPDMGFTFSAKAGILITVPDVAVRGALNGRIMQPAVKISDRSYPPPPGISFLGFIGIDSTALSFGVLGTVDLRPLLLIEVPLAGYFPFGGESDNWYIYLGADGSPLQGRQIGPISAKVLPGILDVGADAYLMMRGKGITNWPHGRGKMIPQVDGFVIAFGFGFQSMFGARPIAWAELYASLDLMIGAKPPTLAGFGTAGGSLNLGPFSLGVRANVNFMAREQLTYFWAEVAGRIELLFFDIEGKVTISFGNEPPVTLPDADLHPLDRISSDNTISGSTVVLTDDSYRVLAPLVEDPLKIKAEMTVWPDAIISLPFVIMPDVAPGATAQFPDADGSGKPSLPVKSGSGMLYYEWKLNRLELLDVTDEANPMEGGIIPDGQLAAKWQVPRGTDSGDISELLLLSTSNTLWVNRLADGGENQPVKPLKYAAEICNLKVNARPGWAIGEYSSQIGNGYLIPPHIISQDPLLSRVEARVYHYGMSAAGKEIHLGQILILPQPFSIKHAQVISWDNPEFIEHEFNGHLLAPNLAGLPGLSVWDFLNEGFAFSGQQIKLVLTDPVIDGVLILIARRELFDVGERFAGILVTDDNGAQWNRELHDLGHTDKEVAGLFRAPGNLPVSLVSVSYPVGEPLGIAGLGGVTVKALDAAKEKNKAAEDEKQRLKDAADAGPKTDNTTNVPHQRAILEPGRLYRLDIDMEWRGEISEQEESGQITVITAQSKDNQVLYAPRGTNQQKSTKRQLFFKTTAKPEVPVKMKQGQKDYLQWVNKRQNVFEPEMIERYLAGYQPGQTEMFYFCDDSLRAHFTQDHVAALALAYGFDIKVAVRRVDSAGPEYADPVLLAPAWSFNTDPGFLSDIDKLRVEYTLSSMCEAPLPGATATVELPLVPETWYEVYILAESVQVAYAHGKLPGVTFRTSRWRSPLEMFTVMGFPAMNGQAPENLITGDLVITMPQGIGAGENKGDDYGYQSVLNELGLDGWPVTEIPRVSRLWKSAPEGWLFCGVMVESPEPLVRKGRVEINGLTLKMDGVSRNLTIHRRDRTGSRLIFLDSNPRPVTHNVAGNPPRIVLSGNSLLNNINTEITGYMDIPLVPSFAGDP